jgi:hypothetical protein
MMMFRRAIALAVPALAFLAGAPGKWTVIFNTQVGDHLTAAGGKLTGKYTSSNGDGEIREGKVEGDDLKIFRNVADITTEEGVAKRVN